MADGHDHRYSDAANRCSDIIRLHIAAAKENGLMYEGRWVAIRLADGGSDGVLYYTRRAAIAHQLHEKTCAYVRVPSDDMSPRSAETFLKYTRQCYDNNIPIADPEAEMHAPQTTLDALYPGGILRDGYSYPGGPRFRP